MPTGWCKPLATTVVWMIRFMSSSSNNNHYVLKWTWKICSLYLFSRILATIKSVYLPCRIWRTLDQKLSTAPEIVLKPEIKILAYDIEIKKQSVSPNNYLIPMQCYSQILTHCLCTIYSSRYTICLEISRTPNCQLLYYCPLWF